MSRKPFQVNKGCPQNMNKNIEHLAVATDNNLNMLLVESVLVAGMNKCIRS